MRPYVIWSPHYTGLHGGVRALHKLRDELRDRNIDAWCEYERTHHEAIWVYPEIVPENISNAPRYVHWLLNKQNIPDSTCFAWESGMGDYPLLTVDIIEPFWRPKNFQRTGVAYWQGKGVLDPSVLPDGASEIGRHNHPERQGLSDYIASLDYLISFDPFTAINIESVISGTPVLIHSQNNQWSREQVEAHGWMPYGVAWSPDELDQARETVHLAAAHYDTKRAEFQRRIDNFIKVTQEKFQ